jgi:hypothetical protein
MKTHSIRISFTGAELVDDLCQAYARLTIAPPASQEAADAYTALQQRKVDVCMYIGSLERHQRVVQDVKIIEVP